MPDAERPRTDPASARRANRALLATLIALLLAAFAQAVVLTDDESANDTIATRTVGIAPQHITVMRLVDLNSDGDVDDVGEQTVIYDAGAPPGTDIQDVLLKY